MMMRARARARARTTHWQGQSDRDDREVENGAMPGLSTPVSGRRSCGPWNHSSSLAPVVHSGEKSAAEGVESVHFLEWRHDRKFQISHFHEYPRPSLAHEAVLP